MTISNSVEDYRYLQKTKPDDFMYSIAVARIYIKHKDFGNAQIEIDRLKKFQENERGLVYQAILFNELENYNQAALTAIDMALNKYPNSIEGLVTKGKILGKLGKEAEACQTAMEAKSKITLGYFGGQQRYLRDFDREIEDLKSFYCK